LEHFYIQTSSLDRLGLKYSNFTNESVSLSKTALRSTNDLDLSALAEVCKNKTLQYGTSPQAGFVHQKKALFLNT